MEREGSFPLDPNLRARVAFLETPYSSESTRDRLIRLARARKDFQSGKRTLSTSAISRKFGPRHRRPAEMASKQLETTLAQLTAAAEAGDEAARARLDRITQLVGEVETEKGDPQSTLTTSSSAAARMDELSRELERERRRNFDRTLKPWRKKFPGVPDEILLRIAERGPGAKPTPEETAEALALAESRLEREEQEMIASRLERMQSAVALAMSTQAAAKATPSGATPASLPSSPPLIDAALFTEDESEDEGTAAVRSARTRYRSGEEYRLLDEETERERDAYRTKSSEGRAEREEREWEESEDQLVPFLMMIDDLALNNMNTFFVLTYTTRSPLGVETKHFLPIQGHSDYKAELSRLKAMANVVDLPSMILKTTPGGSTEIIVPDKTNPREKFVPVKVALRDDAFSDELKASLPAALAAQDKLRTPRILRLYDEEGEYKAIKVKSPTQEDPKEEDGILHINVRKEDIADIELGPKDIMISSVDGVPTFRDQSGTFCFFDKKRGRWVTNSTDTQKEWPLTLFTLYTDLEEHRRNSYAELGQALKVCEEKVEKNKTYKKTIANQKNELATSRIVIDELKDQVRELKKKLDECEKHREELRKKSADSDDSDDDDASVDALGVTTVPVNPDEPEITTLAAATNNKLLNTSIEMWGATSNLAARPWLKASLYTCQSLRVSPQVTTPFLINKLKAVERTKMGELSSEGKITDIATFSSQFLEIYGKKLSPLSQLRDLLKRKMTAAEITKHDYYNFGNKLENDIHEAYNGLGLKDKSLWPTFDGIIALSAYLGAVPSKLAEHLMLIEVETLEAAVKESRKWANAVLDSGQSLAATVGHVGTGGQGQQGQGGRRGGRFGGRRQQQSQPPAQDSQNQQQQQATGAGGASQEGGKDGNRRPPICRKCRALKDPPASCRHCRICFGPHFAHECPKRHEKKEKTD